jgi:hypothetical protein
MKIIVGKVIVTAPERKLVTGHTAVALGGPRNLR